MTINYYNAESLIPVEPIDLSHLKYVFLRKDIEKHTRKGFDEETEQEYWSYKEAKLTKEEYIENEGEILKEIEINELKTKLTEQITDIQLALTELYEMEV